MRKLREVLRLHFEKKLSRRKIGGSVGASSSTVSHYIYRAKAVGLTWPLPAEMDDGALTRLLFPDEGAPKAQRPEPDWSAIHLELKKKHVTKQLLWEEYRVAQPEGYQYSQFCERYARWAMTLQLSMRQPHRAGEKLFIDFSGDGIDVVDPKTGEVTSARLFVAVLGASSLTYVEPVLREDLPTWVRCHVNALEYFGGATELWVPDNLKAGVTKANRFEPDLNPTYAELAQHYGVAVIPARVRRPKDKAKVEVGVLLAQRWIIAALRNRRFFSLEEVRAAVKPLVEKLNGRLMKRLGKSRRQLFEELDRPTLKALPSSRYEFARWAKARVHIDYHVAFDGHFYSVPYQLVGKELELRATDSTVEMLHGGRRVTSHVRGAARGGYTTKPEHMPKAHRDYAEWTPVRLINWAKRTGPGTAALVEGILERHLHPQQGFKGCLGVLSLSKYYDDARIEAACARAVQVRAFSYKSVAAILKNGLDRERVIETADLPLPVHGNIRGAGYYN